MSLSSNGADNGNYFLMNELEEDDSYTKQPGKTVFGNSTNTSVQGGEKPAPEGLKAKFLDAIGWYFCSLSISDLDLSN